MSVDSEMRMKDSVTQTKMQSKRKWTWIRLRRRSNRRYGPKDKKKKSSIPEDKSDEIYEKQRGRDLKYVYCLGIILIL